MDLLLVQWELRYRDSLECYISFVSWLYPQVMLGSIVESLCELMAWVFTIDWVKVVIENSCILYLFFICSLWLCPNKVCSAASGTFTTHVQGPQTHSRTLPTCAEYCRRDVERVPTMSEVEANTKQRVRVPILSVSDTVEVVRGDLLLAAGNRTQHVYGTFHGCMIPDHRQC